MFGSGHYYFSVRRRHRQLADVLQVTLAAVTGPATLAIRDKNPERRSS